MADLTQEELVAYLEAMIRKIAKWKLRPEKTGDIGTLTGDRAAEMIAKVAAFIYDDIVSRFEYDETLLKATRSVKRFKVAYVARVIKSAIKNGLIEESEQAESVKNALEEYFKGKKIIRK